MSGCKISVLLAVVAVCVFSGCGLPTSPVEWREYQAVEAIIARGADLNAPDKDIDGDLRLHRAVSEGYGAVVQLLLDNQTNVDARDKYYYTALHCAAMVGNTRIAEQLLDARAYVDAHLGYISIDTDGPPQPKRITPLHLAAWYGNLDTARLLLARGAKVDVTAPWGVTPLHFAAGSGYLKMVKFLIAHGADPLPKTPAGAGALYFAAGGGTVVLEYRVAAEDLLLTLDGGVLDVETETAHCGDEYGEIVKLLLARGAKVNPHIADRYSPLQGAAQYSCASAVEVLIKAGADVTGKVPYFGEDTIGGYPKGTTALHLAAYSFGVFNVDRYRRTIDALLRAGAPVNAADEHGTTALHIAANNACPEGVKLLISAGANVNARSRSILSHISDIGFPEKLERSLGPPILWPQGKPYDHKMTPLINAMLSSLGWYPSEEEFAKYPHRLRETIAVLLKNGADVKAATASGHTALHIAAGHPNGSPVVKMLIDAGADVNAKTKSGETPLHYAALATVCHWTDESNRWTEADTAPLKILLANGADPNARTVKAKYKMPETALDWAKEEKMDEAVKLLTPVTGRRYQTYRGIYPTTQMYKMRKNP